MKSEYKDYGLEDICESLDGIEVQLKRIVECQKIALLRFAKPNEIPRIEQI